MQRYSCLSKHPKNCTFSDINSKEETQTVRNPHTQTSASAIYIFFTTWMQSLEIKSSSDKSFYLYYLAWFLMHRDIYWTRPNVGSEELAVIGLHSLKIQGLGRLWEGKHMSKILHSFLDSNTLRSPTLTSMCYCYHKCCMYMFNLQQSYQSIPACQEQVEGRPWNPVLNNGLEKEMLEILRNLSLLYKRKTGGQSSLLAALLTESGVLRAEWVHTDGSHMAGSHAAALTTVAQVILSQQSKQRGDEMTWQQTSCWGNQKFPCVFNHC